MLKKHNNEKFPINNQNHYLFVAFIQLFLFSLIFSTQSESYASGQLMVSPSRIVFEGNLRSEKITLINSGSETGHFRISFVRRNMTESGTLSEVKEDEPGMYSDSMIRFSPRQIALPPGKAQTVRLQLRKPRELENGEYRSHMLFQALPDPKTTSLENIQTDDKTMQVMLVPVIGVTIPVIVRQGKLEASVSLSDFKINLDNTVKGKQTLAMKINRNGNSSVYGNFIIEFIPNTGSTVIVAQAKGVAIYTPNKQRLFEIPLQAPEGIKLSNGELLIKYTDPKNKELLTESRLSLP